MFKSLKIGPKIILALVAVAALTTALLFGSSTYSQRKIISEAELRELHAYNIQLQNRLKGESDKALTLAAQIAAQPNVQAAMASGDRAALAAQFVPGFPEMSAKYGVEQFQFHTPPATSFLRVHKPEKFGDDLSALRKAVVEANSAKKAVSGLEVGVAGLGIRGIAPIAQDGAHVGTVEIGMSFGQRFFDDFLAATKARAVLLFQRGDKTEEFATTFPKGTFDAAAEQLRGIGAEGDVLPPRKIDGTSYALIAYPVAGYDGQTLGTLVIGVDRSYFQAQQRSQLITAAIIALVTLGVAFAVALLVNKTIAAPVVSMTEAMQRLAAGDLDADIPAKGQQDEIGEMAQAVEVFKQASIEKIRLQKEAEEERIAAEKRREERRQADLQAEQRAREEDEKRKAEASAAQRQQRLAMADDFEQRVASIVSAVSGASTELSATAESMAESAQRTSGEATQALDATQRADSNVHSVASASEELHVSVKEVSEQLNVASRITRDAVEQANEAAGNVADLEEAGKRISNIIELINNIAAQTNLLALNATIEAARAGEAGRGFAVVASEVKELATQTASATEQVTTQIGGMQEATRKTVDVVAEIRKTIERINDIAVTIASALEEQTAATLEISKSTQYASAETQRVAVSVNTVSSLAQNNGESSGEVLTASRELAMLTERLNSALKTFLAEIRA